MALIECPECHHEVSDKADKCPNCSYPLAPVDAVTPSSAVKNPYRSGAIMGLIGSIAFIVIMMWGFMGGTGGEDTGGVTVAVQSDEASWLLMAALLSILVNAVVFAAALFMVKRANRRMLLGISVVALVFSLVWTLGMVAYLNALILCMGPLFLWEPVLQLVGAVKMVNAALKTNE